MQRKVALKKGSHQGRISGGVYSETHVHEMVWCLKTLEDGRDTSPSSLGLLKGLKKAPRTVPHVPQCHWCQSAGVCSSR